MRRSASTYLIVFISPFFAHQLRHLGVEIAALVHEIIHQWALQGPRIVVLERSVCYIHEFEKHGNSGARRQRR